MSSGRDPQVEFSTFWLSSRLNSVLGENLFLEYVIKKKKSLELTYLKGKTKVARGSRLLCCFPESSTLQLAVTVCDIKLVTNSIHVFFMRSHRRTVLCILY